ncbi:Nn.00g098080.m01.CDS01 [Neocucurbitaria sp. VM-36]
MALYYSLILAFVLFPLRAWCQTVQDDWTAPAAPDGSTPLQSGTKFTLLWKSGLQNSFEAYCPSCDTKKLDLWITNFNGTKYTSKIGRGIDLTTTSSYDWNVNIASNAFSEMDFWVFRFTFFDSADPYTEQISSPGFKISGLVKVSSTVAVQSSSATSAVPTSSSIATTSTSVASSSFSTPQSTEQTYTPGSSSKSNTWISGVVVGPLVGIALGAALMWFCLRKHKNKAQQFQANVGQDQGGHYQEYPLHQDPKEMCSQTVKSDSQQWQHQTGNYGQYIVEAPGSTSPNTQPAELWQGNYRSQS